MRLSNTSRILQRLIPGIVVCAAIAGVSYYAFVLRSHAESPASVPFDHEAMVQAGMTCLFCHAGATKSPAAGIPSMQSCMGCHKVIKTDSPQIKELAAAWESHEPIVWPRVNVLPRFVFFDHQVHVTASLNCERCHGDVGHMSVAEPVVRMNMGWCLSCHEKQSNAAQLRDCVVCHR